MVMTLGTAKIRILSNFEETVFDNIMRRQELERVTTGNISTKR